MEYGISEATRYGITGQQREDPNNPGNYLSQEDSIKLIMRECNPLIVLDRRLLYFRTFERSSLVVRDPGGQTIYPG